MVPSDKPSTSSPPIIEPPVIKPAIRIDLQGFALSSALSAWLAWALALDKQDQAPSQDTELIQLRLLPDAASQAAACEDGKENKPSKPCACAAIFQSLFKPKIFNRRCKSTGSSEWIRLAIFGALRHKRLNPYNTSPTKFGSLPALT